MPYSHSGINLILTTFVYFCIPETKQCTLEEIDAVFGGANHVQEGLQEPKHFNFTGLDKLDGNGSSSTTHVANGSIKV